MAGQTSEPENTNTMQVTAIERPNPLEPELEAERTTTTLAGSRFTVETDYDSQEFLDTDIGLTFEGDIENPSNISGPLAGIDVDVHNFSGDITNSGRILSTNEHGIFLSAADQFSGDISNTGTIDGALNGLNLSANTIESNIVNEGSILATNRAALDVGAFSFSGDITNSGFIGSERDTGVVVTGTDFYGNIVNTAVASISGEDGIVIANRSDFVGNLENAGVIRATDDGIEIARVSNVTGDVINSGNISAFDAGIRVASSVNANITNSGEISAANEGIALDRDTVQFGTTVVNGDISNSGHISGGPIGLSVGGGVQLKGGIDNSGTIANVDTAIVFENGSVIDGALINSGLIVGGRDAIRNEGSDGVTIINDGTIDGNVTLGDGQDFFLSEATGGLVTGVVDGNGGDDVIATGSGADTVFGGSGQDLVQGGAGDDILYGESGNDTLEGGTGNDVLIGGTGADRFVFSNDASADLVQDFGQNDSLFLTGVSSFDQVGVSTDNGSTFLRFGANSVVELEGTTLERSQFNVTQSGPNHLVLEQAPIIEQPSGETVICTHMNKMGYIADDVYRWDSYYGRNILGETVLAGYHVWAVPFVEHVLRKSHFATRLCAPAAQAWAKEMAHRCDPEHHKDGSALGKTFLALGVPLCFGIGLVFHALNAPHKQLP